MSLEDFPNIKKLSTSDKINLVELLWDDIRSDKSSIPIPESHRDELEKRLKNLTESSLLTVKEFKKRIEKQK